ncbi:TPA: helix-turn-helix domain-containing protein [Burkholderia vietnamiensis]|nr:helix-turn-helix domain-containing protein [Burkholderia vietnamiensis]
MAKRRTTQERIADLLARARKLEAQDRAERKAAEAERGRHLAALLLRAGLQDEDQDVILGALIKTSTALRNPSTGDRYRNELLGIARFGDPATLDNLIEAAIVKPHAVGDTAVAPQAFVARPASGTVLAEAPGTISTEEAVKLTGRSAATLHNAVHEGRLYAVRVPGRRFPSWRFDPKDLAAFR